MKAGASLPDAPPPVAPPQRWRFPVTRRTKLGNGLPVEIVHLPGRYVATVVVAADLPLTAEPPGRDGAIAAMACTLSDGAGGLDSDAFALRLGRMGASWVAGAGQEGPRIAMEVPVTRLRPALQLLATAVTEPIFPAEAVRRYAIRVAAQAEQQAASAPGRAYAEFLRATIGGDHRSARAPGGDSLSMRALQRDDLVHLHEQAMTPGSMVLIIVGDLSGIDVQAYAANAFGEWNPAPRVPFSYQPPVPRSKPGVVVVPRPGASQTYIALGCFAPDRRHPEWPALSVAAHLLGAGTNSLINVSLRERSGYSYGFSAGLASMRTGGTFLISGAVRANATDAALRDLHAILVQISAEGFDPRLCSAAIQHIVRAAPLRYESARAVAQQRAEQAGALLSDRYVDQYLAAVSALTEPEISIAFRRLVHTNSLALVVVGDPAACSGKWLSAIASAGFRIT